MHGFLVDGHIWWWIHNLSTNLSRPILRPSPALTLETDSSTLGWGAYCRESDMKTGGLWSTNDQKNHINWLELQGAYLSLQNFLTKKQGIHVLLMMDSQVAISYINKMGGYTLSEALQPCPAAVELVHTEVSNGPRRACTRSTECNCRLREQTFQRFQRLETGPRSVSCSEPNIRTIHSRPVCLVHECTDGSVLQLEAGPQVSGNRCSSTAMGLPPSLPVSSVCTDWSLPAEDSQSGEGTDGCSNSSDLARSDVVSSPSRHVEGAPQETSNTQSTDSEPLEGTTSSSTAGTSDPSRMAYIRRSLSDKGISGEAADIIGLSWRTSTSSHTTPAGTGGLAGVSQGKLILFLQMSQT